MSQRWTIFFIIKAEKYHYINWPQHGTKKTHYSNERSLLSICNFNNILSKTNFHRFQLRVSYSSFVSRKKTVAWKTWKLTPENLRNNSDQEKIFHRKKNLARSLCKVGYFIVTSSIVTFRAAPRCSFSRVFTVIKAHISRALHTNVATLRIRRRNRQARVFCLNKRNCTTGLQEHVRQARQRALGLHVGQRRPLRNRATTLFGKHRLKALLLDVFRGKSSHSLLTLSPRFPSPEHKCGKALPDLARIYIHPHYGCTENSMASWIINRFATQKGRYLRDFGEATRGHFCRDCVLLGGGLGNVYLGVSLSGIWSRVEDVLG